MDAGSAAASLWWTFWGDYLTTVFEPVVEGGARSRSSKDRGGLAVGAGHGAARRGPGGVDARRPVQRGVRRAVGARARHARTAAIVGRVQEGGVAPVAEARRRAGDVDLGAGAHPVVPLDHRRATASATARAPAGGDPFTEDAADGGLNATTGPSWRMIVAALVRRRRSSAAAACYPGGQSENPASPVVRQPGRRCGGTAQYLPLPVPGAHRRRRSTWSLDGYRASSAPSRARPRAACLGRAAGRPPSWCSLPWSRRGRRRRLVRAVRRWRGRGASRRCAGAGWLCSRSAARWRAGPSPLWLMALRGLPVGATARAIAALAGLPPYAAVAVAVTLLLAAAAGAGRAPGWPGARSSAARSAAAPDRHPQP